MTSDTSSSQTRVPSRFGFSSGVHISIVVVMMGSPADPRNQAMASVWPEIMRYQLQVVREELGGIEGFVDSIGFRELERRQLRALLVDPDP